MSCLPPVVTLGERNQFCRQNLPIYIPVSIFVFPKGVNTATIKSLLVYSLATLTIIQPCNSLLAVSCKVCLYVFYFFIKFRKNVVLLSTMHSGSGKYHESKKGIRIITTSSPMHLFKLVTWNIKILLVLVSVRTIPDGFRAGAKIIPDRASVRTQEWLWRRDFCDGSGVTYRIGFVLYFDAWPVAEVNRDLKIRRRRRQREGHKINRFN